MIKDHTEVVISVSSSEELPKAQDIVKIKLEKTGNSYNTRRASKYFGIVEEAEQSVNLKKRKAECESVISTFSGAPLALLSAPVFPASLSPKIRIMSDLLKKLAAQGKLVYVVPGKTGPNEGVAH